ncbi:MAG: SMC-Scp complex subunit ScpB [Nanoarchaeota archaeon]
MQQDLRNKVEATLFAAGDSLSVEDISKLARVRELAEIEEALQQLQKDYNSKDSSLELIKDSKGWKFHVRQKYLTIARRLGVKTELSKTIIETLAILAWRCPVKQSDIVAIRTNKAYDHLDQLEEQGFITRQRWGRTRLIKLAKRFFDYFEITEEEMKKMMERTAQKAEEMNVKMKKKPGEEAQLKTVPTPQAVSNDSARPPHDTVETQLPAEIKDGLPMIVEQGENSIIPPSSPATNPSLDEKEPRDGEKTP